MADVRLTKQAAGMAPKMVNVNPRSLGDVIRDSFYQYAINLPFTAGGGGLDNFNVNIPVQTDAHFLCVQTLYSNSAQVGNAVATTAISYIDILHGGAVVQLTDGGSQRFLSNIQVPINCLFGNAKEPYIWPFTHLFRSGGYIGVNVTGTVAAMASANLRLVFGGFKVPVGAFPALGL